MTSDRLRDGNEGREAAAPRPLEPFVQDGFPKFALVLKDLAELLLEQVGTKQRTIRANDRGELESLENGQVLGVLPQREARSLQLSSERWLSMVPHRIPDLTTNLVESIGGPRHDVERIETQPRLRTVTLDYVFDPGGSICADQCQPRAPFRTQGVEEPGQGRFVTTSGGPHEPSAIVVHDHNQVLVTSAVADLIDADPPQAGQTIHRRFGFRRHARDDGADGPPGHPRQLRDRRSRGVRSQPGGLIFEGTREACAMPSPRHSRHKDAVLGAMDSRRVRFEVNRHCPQIKASPEPSPFARIVASAAPAASAAALAKPPVRPHLRDHTYSGVTKLVSPSWLDGTAVARVLENPLARPGPLRAAILSLPDGLLRLGTWATLALELLFAPLALSRRLRPWIWTMALAMHLGLIALIDFADLSLGMVMLHLFTFDPAWVPAVKPSTTETLFYDGQCGLCHNAVRFLLAEDRAPGGAFRFAPLGGETFQATVSRPADLPDSLALVTDDGRVLTRSRAVLHLGRRLGGLWRVIAGLVGLLPIALLDRAYDAVAHVRHRLFARPEEACPIAPRELRSRLLA